MKYHNKYLNSQTWDEPELNIFKSEIKLPCFICKDYTEWTDLLFGFTICSEECRDKLYKKFQGD